MHTGSIFFREMKVLDPQKADRAFVENSGTTSKVGSALTTNNNDDGRTNLLSRGNARALN